MPGCSPAVAKPARIFQFLLWRYVVERFLFRLSHSPYRDRFVLKGAMLFALWNEAFHRQTQDIDFAAYGDSETDDFVTELQQVCCTGVDDDGVVFHADQISSSTIRGTTDKGGTRYRFPATVGGARITVQVDIGVGDSIQPPPEDAEFPTLLDAATCRVRAYPKEAVVSEKFHATVARGEQDEPLQGLLRPVRIGSALPLRRRATRAGPCRDFRKP